MLTWFAVIIFIMMAAVLVLVTLTLGSVMKLTDAFHDHHYELTHGFYKDILNDSRKTTEHAEKVLDLNSEIITSTNDVVSRIETSNDLLDALIKMIKRKEFEEE